MLDKFRLKKNEKGFTLIELLIVVAIIGILAAIAIPQFAAYRIRGYNSSAQSDIRNLNTTESAFYADWQNFGDTVATTIANPPVYAGSAGAGGAVLTGPTGTINDNTVFPSITATIPGSGRNVGTRISLGNGVTLIADTAVNAVTSQLETFSSVAKHQNGDTYFAVDADSDSIYYDQDEGTADGTAVVPADITGITVDVDDFVGANGPSGAQWLVR
jgi:prepilin-type N-terminal cleavage/methylation domain-containing protein